MRQLKISKQITARLHKSIEIYLKEISKEEMVTPQEEVELARRIKSGDEIALERLVRANLRFVISVAKQYQHHGLELEDLINEGNLGLIEAAKRFDETRGFKFISYAVWWIRQSIIKAIVEKSRKIKLPANKAMAARKLAEAAIELEQSSERVATDEEIGEVMDMTAKEVRDILNSSQIPSSLDAPVGNNDDARSMVEVVPDDSFSAPTEPLINESLRKEIEYALSKISDKEAEIIRLSFGLNCSYPMSLEDIGLKIGVGKDRVRQIRGNALKKIRKHANLEALKAFL